MMSKLGLVLAMCLSVALARRVCPCPTAEEPVCGSDGKTYRNICELNCAISEHPSLTLINEGSCEEDSESEESNSSECICTQKPSPVCGSDGNTYDSSCELECAMEDDPTLSMVSNGPCNESKEDTIPDDHFCNCKALNIDISLLDFMACCGATKALRR